MPARTGGGAGLRLFAALQLPHEHAERLADHAEAIASSIGMGRPTDAATMHLTWAFLGTVAEDYVPAVANALDAAAGEVPGPTLCTTTTASRLARGRVLAVDVDVELFASLGGARDRFLDTVATYAPALDRRPWRPHVTILRAPRDGQLPAELELAPAPPPARWVAPDLCLYASLPGPAGNQHRLLHAVPFGVPVTSR